RNMFLIEPERGCSRGCTYCVMRRTTNGGMRTVAAERVLELIPAAARRVGLVGAAVTDHPRIVELVRTLVDDGRQVGISSLRADRVQAQYADGRSAVRGRSGSGGEARLPALASAREGEIRPTSARWAWVEYMLAQGGPEAGLAAEQAWRAGGSFAAWKRAFADREVRPVSAARPPDGRARLPALARWPVVATG